MTSDLAPTDTTRERALSFVDEATQGGVRALMFAQQALHDALMYQDIETHLAREQGSAGTALGIHPELFEVSDEGERRMKMVERVHRMKVRNAELSIQFAEKACWFKRLVDDSGGPAAGATSADATVSAPDGSASADEDGPLARLRRARPKRDSRTMAKYRDDVTKGAEQILAGESAPAR